MQKAQILADRGPFLPYLKDIKACVQGEREIYNGVLVRWEQRDMERIVL